jgi:hypothetical protein
MIWLGDTYGNFFKSNDRGHTWFLLPGNIYQNGIKGIAFRDSLNGLAVASVWVSGGGNNPGFYADMTLGTNDGGNSWTPRPVTFSSSNVVWGLAMYDVAYVPGTADTYIATSEYDSSYAAFSVITTDGGLTWSLIDSTEQHTACVFTSPTNGYTGGYVKDFTRGIFKWNGALPSGINEHKLGEMVSYPNPATGTLNVELFYDCFNTTVTLTDLHGRKLFSQNFDFSPGKTVQLNTENIVAGLYVLSVSSKEGMATKLVQIAK